MSSPVIIDTHAHLFQPERDAKGLKVDYEIWEFGEKRDVHLSTMDGHGGRDVAGDGRCRN